MDLTSHNVEKIVLPRSHTPVSIQSGPPRADGLSLSRIDLVRELSSFLTKARVNI